MEESLKAGRTSLIKTRSLLWMARWPPRRSSWPQSKDYLDSLRRDERSRRSGRVKSESTRLRVEHDSDSLSLVDRSSSSNGSFLPEWATGPRPSDDSFHCRHPRRQARAAKRRSKNIGRAKGPKYRSIKELVSSHENFNDSNSYQRYRLLNTSKLSGAKVSAMIVQCQRLKRHATETTPSPAKAHPGSPVSLCLQDHVR